MLQKGLDINTNKNKASAFRLNRRKNHEGNQSTRLRVQSDRQMDLEGNVPPQSSKAKLGV